MPLATENPLKKQLPLRAPTSEEVENLLMEEYLRRKAARKSASSFIDYVQQIAPWITIEDPACCGKTFPNFFEVLAAIREGR